MRDDTVDKNLMAEAEKSLESIYKLIEDVKSGVFGNRLDPNSGLMNEVRNGFKESSTHLQELKHEVMIEFENSKKELELVKIDVAEIKAYHNSQKLGVKWARNLGAGLIALFGIVKFGDFLHWLGLK